MPRSIRLRRVCGGVYETHDGRHRIIRTDAWNGPKGGTYSLWEHATPDEYAGWVIDGYGGYRTKREAVADLSARGELS